MDRLLEKAVDLARRGKWDEGLRAYGSLIAQSPALLEPRCHRATLLIAMGRYEDAIEDYRYLIAGDARNADVRVRCADVLRKLDRIPDAIALLKEALDIDPHYGPALETWAHCAQAKAIPREKPAINPHIPKPNPKPLHPLIQSLAEDPDNFPGSIHPLIGELISAFIRCYQPEIVVETGCLIGFSTLHIAQALEENGKGHLHSFDLFLPMPSGYKSPVLGECTDSLAIARAHLETGGLAHRVTLHPGDSSSNISATFEGRKDAIDMAFIDGDHTVGGCMKDWAAIEPHLMPGGIVLLHDIEPEVCWYLGPRYLMDKACAGRSHQFQTLSIRTPDGPGLGVVQKIAATERQNWDPPFRFLVKDYLMKSISRMGLSIQKKRRRDSGG